MSTSEQQQPESDTVSKTTNQQNEPSNQLIVNSSENSKRVMFLAKEMLLKDNEFIDLVSGTQGAPVSTRAAESLVRLGYVTYDAILTDTCIIPKTNKRRTKFIIRLRKAKDFKLLYDENEEIRKRTQELKLDD